MHEKRRIVELLNLSDPHELLSVLSSDKDFCECVLSGSLSFYNFLNKSASGKEKISNNLLHSLIGYCSRVYARATPYGFFAGVSSGVFDKQCTLNYSANPCKEKIVQSDSLWLFSLIKKIEGMDGILEQLRVVNNPNCYKTHNRYKNPHVSDFGSSNKSKSTSSIKNTKPLDYIISVAKKPVVFSLLERDLAEKYSVPKQVVFEYLRELVASEYLLSELRTPVLTEEPLQHIIAVLGQLNLKNDDLSIYTIIKEIYEMIIEYNNNPTPDLYLIIFNKMNSLINEKDCLHSMVSVELHENTLSADVFDELTRFINVCAKMVCDIYEPVYIKNYKRLFLNKYNSAAEVNLLELLDDDIGLGNPYEKNLNDTPRTDKTFNHYMDFLIDTAIKQGKKEVVLADSDIEYISNLVQTKHNKLREFSGSLELCVKICSSSISDLNKGNYSIIVGENVGSDRCGAYSNRFSRILPEDYASRMSNYYEDLKRTYNCIDLVDAKELPTKGRLSNVTCGNVNYDSAIMLGYYWPNLNQLDLNDIVIGYDPVMDILYARSLGKDAIIKVDSDNMLNSMSNSPHLRFLREIGYAYSAHPLSIFGEIPFDKVYCPEIRYGKIVIRPETWNLSNLYIDISSYNSYYHDIKKFKKCFEMPQYVYLCDGDHTVLLNLDNDLCLQYLYKEMETRHNVKVIASEYNDYLTWDNRDEWNDYMTEYVFSFMKTKPLDIEFPPKKHIASELDFGRKFAYGENNWLYCKIYINFEYRDEYISEIAMLLQELLKSSLIDKGFYIQYSDDIDGYHLRIRLHAIGEIDTVKNLFLEWLAKISINYYYKKICFDTYEREIERYGGKYSIDIAEELFCVDSLLVSNLYFYRSTLSINEDVIAFYLSFSLLLTLFGDLELLCKELDKFIHRKENKKEYYLKKKDFEIIVDNPSKFIQNKVIMKLINNRTEVACKFSDKILNLYKNSELSSTKRDIFLSINHMFCNRIKADNLWERKIVSFVRHFSYDLLQKQRHLNIGE